nr:MAG TPA: hypothetical protein [Bacteriophage sp.]
MTHRLHLVQTHPPSLLFFWLSSLSSQKAEQLALNISLTLYVYSYHSLLLKW